jgi:hypothetical protein
LDFILTDGKFSNVGQDEALLQLTPAGAAVLLGNKDCDSGAFILAIQERKMQA